MGIDLGRTEAERGVLNTIIQSVDDRTALKMLREETALLVLMVRVDNEERKVKFKETEKEE